jgi:hypothetical protein
MTPEESLPSRRPTPTGAILTVWVIYDHPKDFAHGYVLRAQWAMADGAIKADEVAWYADVPDKLRAILPPGLVQLARHPNDDAAVLETWL